MFTAKQGAKLEAANALHKIRDSAVGLRSLICFEHEDVRVLDGIIEDADSLLAKLIIND